MILLKNSSSSSSSNSGCHVQTATESDILGGPDGRRPGNPLQYAAAELRDGSDIAVRQGHPGLPERSAAGKGWHFTSTLLRPLFTRERCMCNGDDDDDID